MSRTKCLQGEQSLLGSQGFILIPASVDDLDGLVFGVVHKYVNRKFLLSNDMI